MSDATENQQALQREAELLLRETPLLEMLSRMGTPIRTGSSVTGLMAYPDIDFAVQHEDPDFGEATRLVPEACERLGATAVKIADFTAAEGESAAFYVGIEMPFRGRVWHIDATITKPGPIATNPPEMAGWLEDMSDAQRETILVLKRQLIDAGRYVGARSRPPYTFRSAHLYEAVLQGDAASVSDLEKYYASGK